MNYKAVFNVLGKVMVFFGFFMLVPMLVGAIYGENTFFSFLIPVAGIVAIGLPLSLMKVRDKAIYAKEGFVIVALTWILMSLVGAVPFVISGVIPSYVDALFETASGLSTTGASVMTLSFTEILIPKSVMFWRILTHWLGGMGILVFALALLPSEGNLMHVFRAESPGPSASKLVSKISFTARILYGIYIALTLLETVLLLFSGMGFYESLLNSFSTAGTGGFGIYADSIAHYNSVYVETVIATFMMLFGVNFNVFYLIITGNVLRAIKSEELIAYFCILIAAVVTIAVNTLSVFGNFWVALRYSYFQTTAIASTTGFSSYDFVSWPALSKGIILFLSVVGACGGSTGGGIKVSRLIILVKAAFNDLKKCLHPRSVNTFKLESEPVAHDVERTTKTYFLFWVGMVIITTLALSFDPYGGQDLFTNFSATIACIGNIGPGVTAAVGPAGGFAAYGAFSKALLSFVMLAGRLEIVPVLLLLAPRTWKKG